MTEPTNQFSIFDPLQYSNLALIQLHKALGMASRVYRGYDKVPQQKGSTIAIPIPSTFVAQDAPGNDMAINADSINITLNRWKEVKFALSDKELNYTQQEIIDKHIIPAAYALADQIDMDLCSLASQVPWNTGTAGTVPSTVASITGVRKMLFNNKVPLVPGAIHLMIDGNAEDSFLQLPAFTQYNGSGDVGVGAQLRGSLGTRYGMEIFANQNVITNVPGVLTSKTAVVTANDMPILGSIINLSGTALVGTVSTGDIIQFAGDTQNYAVVPPQGVYGAYTYTAAGNAIAGINIYPHLRQANTAGTAVTITQTAGVRNVAFHNNAFALAMAPLSDMANNLGAMVSTVSDPVTGLALRSRVWYNGDGSTVKVGLDVLYGFRVLDPNLAANLLG